MTDFRSNVLAELEWRGLIHQLTDESLDDLLVDREVTLYCGFDPTAESLQVGNLLPLMTMAHFRRHGHEPLALVGGATGLIGDPSGKSEERELLDQAELEHNVAVIVDQMDSVLDRATEMHPESIGAAPSELGEGSVPLVNNADWTKEARFVDVLRDIGKHFRINKMTAKESIRARLEEREQGISYTEFSYMVLQAWDFLHLYQNRGCDLQIGGSDQWGNITAGIDLIRGKLGETAYGLTAPLVTTRAGEKLGKTAEGTVWLDGDETSPYEFFQYWVQRSDQEAPNLLRKFTFLPREEIQELEATIEAGENRGEVQRQLAWEVTALVHGESEADLAEKTSSQIREGRITELSEEELDFAAAGVPSSTMDRADLESEELGLKGLLRDTGLQDSGSAAKRLIKQGGAYVGEEKIEDVGYRVGPDDLIPGTDYLVLRSGKSNYHLVKFE